MWNPTLAQRARKDGATGMVVSVTLRPSAARLRWVQRLDRSQPARLATPLFGSPELSQAI